MVVVKWIGKVEFAKKLKIYWKSWFPLLPKTFLLEALGYFMISICLTRISMFFKSWVQRLRGESTDWDIILDQTYSGFSTLIGWKLKESTSHYLVKKLNTGWLVTIMNIWRKILICFLYFTSIIIFPNRYRMPICQRPKCHIL